MPDRKEAMRQQALQIAAQLPANRADALAILEMAAFFVTVQLGDLAHNHVDNVTDLFKIVG